jgi:type IV pilus assembly protein PilB
MRNKSKLGEILVEAGRLTNTQLQQALAEHKKKGLKLGQYLVREGYLSESEIVDVLSRQLKLEKYRPAEFPLDMTLSKVLPADLAHRCQAVPLKKAEMLLTVAMTDPQDIRAIDAIEQHVKTEVEIILCTEQHLNHLISSIYGLFVGMDEIIDGMGKMEIDQEEEKTDRSEDIEMGFLQDMAEEAPVVALVNSFISQAIRDGASDVHICPQKDRTRVRFRVDGKLYDVPSPPKKMFLPIVSRLKILGGMDIAVSRTPQDGRFTVRVNNRDINVRASTIPSIYGENVVLRLLDTSSGIYSLERIGMAEGDQKKVEEMIARPYGMILSTGPTGSGKSTSLYSIIKKINEPDRNIITIEDPVEYRIENILQVQLNNKAGMTFSGGLRSILRQDPDVVMVGEIRDAETAKIAVQAALTGHLVLTTLHTNDAAGAITRLIDMGVEPFLVSSVLGVSFSQRLVRKVCPSCKEAHRPSDDVLRYWQLEDNGDYDFMHGKGCFHCMHTGYKGRTGVYEVLTISNEIQDMILNKMPAHEITRTAISSGLLTPLKDNAMKKVIQGITTFEEAASAVLN